MWPSHPSFLDNRERKAPPELKPAFYRRWPPDVGLLLGCCSPSEDTPNLQLVRSAHPSFGSDFVLCWACWSWIGDGDGGSSESDHSCVPLSLPCLFTHLVPSKETVGLSVKPLGRRPEWRLVGVHQSLNRLWVICARPHCILSRKKPVMLQFACKKRCTKSKSCPSIPPTTHPFIHPGPNASPLQTPAALLGMLVTPCPCDMSMSPSDRLLWALAERGPEDPLRGAARVPRHGAKAPFLLVLAQHQLVQETPDSAGARLGASLPGQGNGARG